MLAKLMEDRVVNAKVIDLPTKNNYEDLAKEADKNIRNILKNYSLALKEAGHCFIR